MAFVRAFVALFLISGCGASAPDSIRLRQIVLYRNGVGYFEHRGAVADGAVSLRLGSHEVDDFLSTVTVVDAGEGARAPSAVVPRELEEGEARTVTLAVAAGSRDVLVAYVSPTSVWRASYRLILDEAPSRSLLQAWAIVDNTSAGDWREVELTLATQAPFSFAVDLRTPRLVERPDVTGYLAPRMTFGPVVSSSGREVEEPDRDHDGILDAEDRCPSDPETHNRVEEDDGCPDRGMVLIEERSIQILANPTFAANSSVLAPSATTLLDRAAETLRDNPHIRTVEIGGHAASNERDPWAISAERAAAVRRALIERGIESERLVVQAYAATRPLVAGPDERNQRVQFVLLARDPAGPSLQITADALERTGRSVPPAEGASGGTRYPIARRVSIPSGGSAMVSVLSTRIDAGEVLYFQPDPHAPGSDAHPFRAARMANASGVDLVPGPVALFREGEFVGEGLFDAITPGETAFIPYAIDTSSHAASAEATRSEPRRIVALHRGALLVERTSVRETTYTIEPGAHLPAHWYVRHLVSPGFEARIDEGMLRLGAAVIAPGAVTEGRRSSISIVETRIDRAEVDLFRDLSFDLRPFLAESALEASIASRLVRLQEDRDRLTELATRASELHTRLAESSERAAELRASLNGILESRQPEIARVRRELAARLQQATRDSETASAELANVRASEEEARARLRSDYREFAIPRS